MNNIFVWVCIILSVAFASATDSISAIWAKGENKFSIYLLLIFLLSPLIFIFFGLLTTKVGLAISSGVINSLIVLSTMCIGLFIFGEWSKISALQYMGMVFAVAGIILMLFFPKTT